MVFTSQTRIGGPNLEIEDASYTTSKRSFWHWNNGNQFKGRGWAKIKGSFETYFFRTLTVQPAASTANQLTDFNKFCAEKRCATASVSTTFLVTLTYKFVVTTINKENLNCSKLECLISAACYIRRSTMNVWRVNSWRGKWSSNNNSLWLYLSGLMRGQRHDRES